MGKSQTPGEAYSHEATNPTIRKFERNERARSMSLTPRIARRISAEQRVRNKSRDENDRKKTEHNLWKPDEYRFQMLGQRLQNPNNVQESDLDRYEEDIRKMRIARKSDSSEGNQRPHFCP